jgi:hypothetical protein
VDRLVRKAKANDPDSYWSRRLAIPIFVNWALETARHRDVAGARALASRVVRPADEPAAREKQYSRAPGWPPRVQGWLAELYELMGDRKAAEAAGQESRKLWKAVARRADLPEDLLHEARRAMAAGE